MPESTVTRKTRGSAVAATETMLAPLTPLAARVKLSNPPAAFRSIPLTDSLKFTKKPTVAAFVSDAVAPSRTMLATVGAFAS